MPDSKLSPVWYALLQTEGRLQDIILYPSFPILVIVCLVWKEFFSIMLLSLLKKIVLTLTTISLYWLQKFIRSFLPEHNRRW